MTDRRYFQFVHPLELGYIFITEWGWPCGKASPIGLEDFLPVCDAGKGAPLTGLPFLLSLLLPATPPPNNHGDTPPDTQNVPKDSILRDIRSWEFLGNARNRR